VYETLENAAEMLSKESEDS